MNKYEEMIKQLKNKEVDRIEISKEEFLEFRQTLVADELFKHFRGEAKQGGSIVYTFLEEPRS